MVSMDVAARLGRYVELVRRHPFRLEDIFTALQLSESDVFARPLGTHFITNLHRCTPMDLAHEHFGQHIFALHAIKNTTSTFPILDRLLRGLDDKSTRRNLAAKVFAIEAKAIEEERTLDNTVEHW